MKATQLQSVPAPLPSARAKLASAENLARQHLVSVADFSPQEIRDVLDMTTQIKKHPGQFRGTLVGCHVALFFEKPSLRTRLTFEAGVAAMGGTTSFVDQRGERMDEREKLSDIAHNLERWVQAVVLRTFAHATVTGMAEHSRVPVINALTDQEHPCQALADYFTLQEKFGDLRRIRLAYVGDGNNVAHSLILAAAALGSAITVATPAGHEPDSGVVAAAQKLAAHSGARIELTQDPKEAVRGADAVYTDVWASMGQESEAPQRKALFAAYQVNDTLFAHASSQSIFMHCLPAHRGEEVTDSVIDSPRSVVFDQAENRMHVQKAILLFLLGSDRGRFAGRSAHAR
jgi:ornithine carbamoyltransferase